MRNLIEPKKYAFDVIEEHPEHDLLYAFSKFLELNDKIVYIAMSPKFEYNGKEYFIKTRKIDYAKDPVSCFNQFLQKEDHFNIIAVYSTSYSFYPLQPDIVHTSFLFKYEIIK